MSSPTTLFLDQVYTIDGVKVTGAQIKEHIIDSKLYRKHLKELRGDDK